jgi:hypothetical protein
LASAAAVLVAPGSVAACAAVNAPPETMIVAPAAAT